MENNPVGTSWKEYKQQHMNKTEREELKLKADIICELIEARKSRGMTQKLLEEVTGVKQPIIARMENGNTDPRLTTLLKLLRPLGKTLAIVDLEE